LTDWISLHSLTIVAVGAGSGVLSALAGVGGAVVSTPGIRALGASPIVSVGSTVPAIIPGAITGTIRYAKQGLVDWRVGLGCGSAGAVSALGGAWLSDHVDGRILMVLTAFLVLWSSLSVLRRNAAPTDDPADGAADIVDEQPDLASLRRNIGSGPIIRRKFAGGGASRASRAPLPMLFALGLGAGVVAGLLGVGGGIVLVPAFTILLGMDVKETIATSLVAVAMMSTTSLAGHIIEGHVHWSFALPLAVGVVPGARLGSRIAVAASQRTMGLICGWLLLVLGLVYLGTELARL
jgi:hypothetical protein